MKNIATTKISKWGNGYGLRIPISMMDSQSLKEGEDIMLTSLPEEGILIEKILPSVQDMTLEEIFEGFMEAYTEDERKEIDDFFGKPVGREIW